MKVVFFGLSITSSWGNGHATNYRALVGELAARGHEVVFCERDVPWYAAHRDLSDLPGARLCLYGSLSELHDQATEDVRSADLVVLGSYVPDGVAVGEWAVGETRGVSAFYDIDTPITLAALRRNECEYLSPALAARFDLYLSFTGGPILRWLEQRLGVRRARAFYCLVDPAHYQPEPTEMRWDLGYLGTWSDDRQPAVEELLLHPARRQPELRCVVAGSRYPDGIVWPANVERIEHLPPARHPEFYCAQRFTLNVTRAEMRRTGWSPSVRLFEAAACGIPVISDRWPGIEELFTPGQEILLAETAADVAMIVGLLDDGRRREIGARARARVLCEHTAACRVDQLEHEVTAVRDREAVA